MMYVKYPTIDGKEYYINNKNSLVLLPFKCSKCGCILSECLVEDEFTMEVDFVFYCMECEIFYHRQTAISESITEVED